MSAARNRQVLLAARPHGEPTPDDFRLVEAEVPAGPDRVPLLMHDVLVKRLTFRGFIVGDFAPQFPEALADLTGWLREGRLEYREDVTDGLENAPRQLIGLLRGENFGKKLIRVGPGPTGR